MYFSLFLLALSLSIDAFSVGMSYGLKKIKIPFMASIIIGIISFLVTILFVFFGKFISQFIPPLVFKIIGIGMLIIMGILIIFQSRKKENPKEPAKDYEGKILSFIINSYSITIKIIRDPKSGDLNNSKTIEALEAIYIGLALCIDSIGAAMASVSIGIDNIIFPLAVAIMQILFINSGSILGSCFVFKNIKENYILGLSGLLLIFTAIIRIF